MTEFWDKPAEKSGKVLAAFLEGLPLGNTIQLTRAGRRRWGGLLYKGRSAAIGGLLNLGGPVATLAY